MVSGPVVGTPVVALPVLRGEQAVRVRLARLDADLRTSPWAQRYGADPRLVDPRLEEAFDEAAEAVRAAARAEGYAAGWAEGQEAARSAATEQAARQATALAAELATTRARVDATLTRLDVAAATLEQTMAPAAAEVESTGLRLAAELVKVLVAHELAVAENPGRDALRRALALAPSGRPVVVRLHPDDLAVLADPDHPEGIDPTEALGRDVRCVADAAVERGGAVADCDATRVDAQLGPAVARVRAVLDQAAAGSAG